ncbi:putative quorum-sensing-regulated virulence factor [Pectobacterium versatile]|uniref:putative quorum-sensing-regulated virulence factor n=1 Tax=Pectobacterium versatile TaxID=2488639 RepID=UPI001CCC8C59|nr:DUF3820 family protein [Pectobacterium versatile]
MLWRDGCFHDSSPEEYLLWFSRKDEFPHGRLGELMQITLAIKVEGLQGLVTPLKRPRP